MKNMKVFYVTYMHSYKHSLSNTSNDKQLITTLEYPGKTGWFDCGYLVAGKSAL